MLTSAIDLVEKARSKCPQIAKPGDGKEPGDMLSVLGNVILYREGMIKCLTSSEVHEL